MFADAALVVLQTGLLVLVAPLWPGLVNALMARLQMRRGPSVLQRWHDLVRLAGKETVVSSDASPFARLAPYLVLAASLAVATWIPVLIARGALGFAGDLVTTVALLAAIRLLLALLALEAGTAFGGMAASRHLMLSALAEPALILAVFTLAAGTGSTDLGQIAAHVARTPGAWLAPPHLLAMTATALVVVSETGRVPVDNPATHLELTMVHEGLSLDVSGRHLAMLEWAAALRQIVLFTLLVNLFLPFGMATARTPAALLVALAAWLAKLGLAAIAIALLASLTARMRLFRVPEFLGMAFLLALLGFTSQVIARS